MHKCNYNIYLTMKFIKSRNLANSTILEYLSNLFFSSVNSNLIRMGNTPYRLKTSHSLQHKNIKNTKKKYI